MRPYGQKLRRQASGAPGVGGDFVAQQAVELGLGILPINRHQLIAVHEPKLSRRQAQPVDEIDQQLAVIDIDKEVQSCLERGRKLVDVVRVVQVRHVQGHDIVEFQIVPGRLDLGQPWRDIQQIEFQRIALPFIWAVTLGVQPRHGLEIRDLLIHRELCVTQTCAQGEQKQSGAIAHKCGSP